MKKATKAAIAGAAGITLLAGGATFATWSQSADVGGAAITSGTLALTDGVDGWWDLTTGTATSIEDIETYLIVPGATYQYRGAFTIDATGENLSADLAATVPVKSGSDAIAAQAVVASEIKIGGQVRNSHVVTPADDDAKVEVTITVSIPDDVEGGQNQTFTISDAHVTLTQIDPSTPNAA